MTCQRALSSTLCWHSRDWSQLIMSPRRIRSRSCWCHLSHRDSDETFSSISLLWFATPGIRNGGMDIKSLNNKCLTVIHCAISEPKKAFPTPFLPHFQSTEYYYILFQIPVNSRTVIRKIQHTPRPPACQGRIFLYSFHCLADQSFGLTVSVGSSPGCGKRLGDL